MTYKVWPVDSLHISSLLCLFLSFLTHNTFLNLSFYPVVSTTAKPEQTVMELLEEDDEFEEFEGEVPDEHAADEQLWQDDWLVGCFF